MDPLSPFLGYVTAITMFLVVLSVLVAGFWLVFRQLWGEPDTPRPKLYVRGVVPNYALRDFQRGGYSAWYLGHECDAMLEDDSLSLMHDRYEKLHEDDYADGLSHFLDWLETEHGYTVFYTGGDDGVAVIDVDRDDYDDSE